MIEVANEVDKNKLLTLMQTYPEDEEKKIEAVKNIFQKNNIQHLADVVKETYQNQAMQHLAKVNIHSEQKQQLKTLAEQLLKRNE